MSYIGEVSWMSESGYSDIGLLEYINKHFDEIECEFNGEEYKEPKKHDHYFCMDCKLRKIVDYERSTLVCTKCGLGEYYPVYVASYNHTMQPSRRKCIYKSSDNFKVILNQFFYGGKRVVPDDIMETIRGVTSLEPYFTIDFDDRNFISFIMKHFLYDTHTIPNIYTHLFKPLYDSLRGSISFHSFSKDPKGGLF